MACVYPNMDSKKYHDAEWLREKYYGEELTLKEMGDLCGVSTWTIGNWMDKHDIERRGRREAQRPEGKHTDREWLAEQYHGKECSLSDIADECGVNQVTIMNWMERHNIPRRGYADHLREERASFNQSEYGHEFAQVRAPAKADEETDMVYIHQLVAIANGADPHKIFSNGEYQCHHKNGIPWDNRPENIEVVTEKEHADKHWPERERAATGEFL